jgi:hypothetical protein
MGQWSVTPMKINVVYDNDGRILAASLDSGQYLGPKPISAPGEHAAEIDVPPALGETSLEEICVGFRVDPKTKSLIKW